MLPIETRSLSRPPETDAARPGVLTGYAALYDSPSEVLAERGRVFREVVRRGAFAAALAGGDVFALWQHGTRGGAGSRPPLGRTPDTLRLFDDPLGLRFELTLPETAADVREAVARRDVRGMSFGFPNGSARDRWSVRDGGPFRELLGVDLVEISLVMEPAYRGTSVGVRDTSGVVIPAPSLSVPLARLRLAESNSSGR